MDQCFVIQPFDGGAFDARYDDLVAPAVRAAGLSPYRVDRDPKASIPIQEIETQIRNSRICLADISLDNPNVWFELGFAIASLKDVVMICSEQRQTKFPFDVQHRSIISYKTTSPRDFAQLQGLISSRLSALLEKEVKLSGATELSKLKKVSGLEQHEVVLIAAIGENISSTTEPAATHLIRQDMERSGFTQMATTIGLRSLSESGMIAEEVIEDEQSYRYAGYSLTKEGWAWILANQDKFLLQKPARPARARDDDVPF